jgi:hypothetical protein
LFFRAPDLSADDQSKPCTGGAADFFAGKTSEDLTGGGEAGFAAA